MSKDSRLLLIPNSAQAQIHSSARLSYSASDQAAAVPPDQLCQTVMLHKVNTTLQSQSVPDYNVTSQNVNICWMSALKLPTVAAVRVGVIELYTQATHNNKVPLQ